MTAFVTLFHSENTGSPFRVSCVESSVECAAVARIAEEWKDDVISSPLGEGDDRLVDDSGIVKRLNVRYAENRPKSMGEIFFQIQKAYPPIVPVQVPDRHKRLRSCARFIHARMDGGLSTGFGTDPDYLSVLDKAGEEQVRVALRIFVPNAAGVVVTSVRERPGVTVLMVNYEDVLRASRRGDSEIALFVAGVACPERRSFSAGRSHRRLAPFSFGGLVASDFSRLQGPKPSGSRDHAQRRGHYRVMLKPTAREICESDAWNVRLDRTDEDGPVCQHPNPAVYEHETLSASPGEMTWEVRGMNTAIPEECKVLLACEGGWDVVFIRAMISHDAIAGHACLQHRREKASFARTL